MCMKAVWSLRERKMHLGHANGGPVRRLSREEIERIEYQRDVARVREALSFSNEMSRQHGAPDDCQITPFDCVMLRQSIESHGNEVPGWILSASRAWLAANGLRETDLVGKRA